MCYVWRIPTAFNIISLNKNKGQIPGPISFDTYDTYIS